MVFNWLEDRLQAWYNRLYCVHVEWEQKSKPPKILRASNKSQIIPRPKFKVPKKSHAEFLIRQNCQRNDAAGIQGNYHKTSDYFEYPKKSLLKSSYPKNTCQNFPTQKNPKIKIFKPKKILQSSLSLEIQSTPLGSCLIAEMLSTPGKVIRLSLCEGEDFKATWYGKEVATESLFV